MSNYFCVCFFFFKCIRNIGYGVHYKYPYQDNKVYFISPPPNCPTLTCLMWAFTAESTIKMLWNNL